MKILSFSFLVFISLFSNFSQALSLGRVVYVDRVFSEGNSGAGFYPVENLPECKWGLMYFSLSNEAGKAMFSLALTAMTAKQPVTRIDYVVNPSGTCSVTGFHVSKN